MNRLNTLTQLLATMLMLGVLAQVASLSYHASAAAASSANAHPIDLALSKRLNEAARVDLIRRITGLYGFTVADRTALWQADELSSIKYSLDQISQRFSELTGRDGQKVMRHLFKGIALYRDRYWRGNIAYTIGGTVTVYDVWARYDETGRAFYLAHELGHVLDAQASPLHLLLGEVSQTFARNLDAGLDDNGVYHLGRTYPLRDPRDRPRHRTDNAAEDWAESFATVAVPAFEAELRDIGEARRQEVLRFVTLWAAQTFGEYKLQPRARRP